MLNKIYLALLAVAVLVMAFFTYYCWSWLQSIGVPRDTAANYEYFAELSWFFLWISAPVLLVIGNVILWISRHAWAMWVAAAYFAVFVLLKGFWLDPSFAVFRRSSGLPEDSFTLGPFAAVVLCFVAAGIVFFDQFIISRFVEKMHPARPKLHEEVPAAEND